MSRSHTSSRFFRASGDMLLFSVPLTFERLFIFSSSSASASRRISSELKSKGLAEENLILLYHGLDSAISARAKVGSGDLGRGNLILLYQGLLRLYIEENDELRDESELGLPLDIWMSNVGSGICSTTAEVSFEDCGYLLSAS